MVEITGIKFWPLLKRKKVIALSWQIQSNLINLFLTKLLISSNSTFSKFSVYSSKNNWETFSLYPSLFSTLFCHSYNYICTFVRTILFVSNESLVCPFLLPLLLCIYYWVFLRGKIFPYFVHFLIVYKLYVWCGLLTIQCCPLKDIPRHRPWKSLIILHKNHDKIHDCNVFIIWLLVFEVAYLVLCCTMKREKLGVNFDLLIGEY